MKIDCPTCGESLWCNLCGEPYDPSIETQTGYMRLAPDGAEESFKLVRTEGNYYQTYRRTVTLWEKDGDPYVFGEEHG